jgi:nucleoside-diphosphate-sugar epimerase
VVGVANASRDNPPGTRRLDLTAATQVKALVDEIEPEVVFHLAAPRARGTADAHRLLEAEKRMLDNLVEALAGAQHDATMVVMGSAAEYGDPHVDLIDEDTPLAPATPYGAAKARLEQAALGSGAPVIWLRAFNVLGPAQPPGHPVSDWSSQLIELERAGGGELRTGRLDVVRDFLDVRDVARGILAAAALRPPVVANLCSGVPVKLLDLVKRLGEQVDAPIEIAPDPASAVGSPARVVGDPSRLLSLTGWSPGISLAQSLRDGLEWIRSQALTSAR